MAADKLNSWTEKWCVAVNKDKDKSSTTLSLSPKQKAGTITLGGTPLKEDEEATYLGITFDKRQIWKQHIAKAEAKARRRLAILHKLAGTTWGASEKILKTVYQGTVRPYLEYGSTAWSTTAKTNQQALDKVQNQAPHLITGAMRSTPITEIKRLTGVQPLGQRRDAKDMMQAEKFKCLTNHPMKTRLEGLTKNRLKRSSFVHDSNKLSRQFHDRLPQSTLPFFPPDMSEPWVTDITDIKVHTTVPSLSDGDTQDGTVKQSLTLAMIAEKYPQEAWIHVFTDRSATNAVTNGGAGLPVHFPGGQKVSASMAVGQHCSNYRAETEALIQAASIVQASDHDCKQVVFLSDALSVLQAYQNHKLPNLTKALQQVAATRRAVLQWIPAHCGISGNEQADTLAKKGARGEQHANNVSFSEKKTLIRVLTMPRSQRDDYHLLSLKQQVILVRLCPRHNRLNSHMHRKLKLAPSPTCPCGQEEQTTEHVLQRCPLYKATREDVWPVSTPLTTKLYGCKQELEKTTSFISRTALTV